MGFLSSLTGSAQGRAATAAADNQVRAIDKGTNVLKANQQFLRNTKNEIGNIESRARKDFGRFRTIGESGLNQLRSLTTDSNARRNFIENDPFFESLADDAQSRLFKNQAARGKVGTGGTAAALQNSLLLLGNDLVGEQINRLSGLSNLGLDAARGQSAVTAGTLGERGVTNRSIANLGVQETDLITDRGDAIASGLIGKADRRGEGASNILSAGLKILGISDERMKEDKVRIGTTDAGLPVYKFRYLGDRAVRIGVMAQDVEKVFPDAVHEIDGIKHVDHGMIQ